MENLKDKIKRLQKEMQSDVYTFIKEERSDIRANFFDKFDKITQENINNYIHNYCPCDEYESTAREAWYIFAMYELLKDEAND